MAFLLWAMGYCWFALASWLKPAATINKRCYRRHLPPKCHTRHSRRKPRWVIREIISLKALTNQSCYKLAHTFKRLYAASHGVTVGKTFVAEQTKLYQYAIADLRGRYKRRIPPPLARNVIWGLDFTGKGDEAGNTYAIIGIIDHGIRLALSLRALPNRTAVTTLKALLIATEAFGIPKVIKTDNDAVFRSCLFQLSLRWLGIRQQFSQPATPWQNGRVERLLGTLKEKLDQLAVPNFNALEQAMIEFRFWYNHVRPHQHLNGWTPAEVWLNNNPYRTEPKSAHLFEAWDGLLSGIYLRR